MSAAVVVSMLAVSAWAWTRVPAGEPVPVQWGADGEVKSYGNKFVAFLIAPLVTLAATLVLALWPRLVGQRLATLQRAANAYSAMCIGVLLILLAAHLDMVFAAVRNSPPIPMIPYVALGVLLLLAANFVRKALKAHRERRE
jgi:hypothetical protein